MSNNKISVIDISENEIKEIVNKANKATSKISKIEDTFNYSEELNKIVIPSSQNKVIYTDGMNQLKYENGEFFKINTKDSTKEKVKLTRKEATDMYVEFFIKNRLNPLIAKKQELNSLKMKLNNKEKLRENVNSLKSRKPRKLKENDIIR